MWPMRTLRFGRIGAGALTPIGSSEGRSGPNQSHFLEYRSLHESRSERPLRARCGIWRAVRVPHAYPVSQAYRTTALAPIGTSSGPSGVATGPLFCLSGIARKIDPIGCDRRLALGEAAEGPCVWPVRTLRPGRIGTGALTPIGSSEGRSGPNQSHFLEYRSLHESRSERPLRARCGIWRAVRVPHAYPVSQAYRTTALAPIGTSGGPLGAATGPLLVFLALPERLIR